MDGAGFRRAIRLPPFRRIQKGDRVRIVMGSLTDFRGTVIDLADNCRLVLRIDDVNEGVRVILPFVAVELAAAE